MRREQWITGAIAVAFALAGCSVDGAPPGAASATSAPAVVSGAPSSSPSGAPSSRRPAPTPEMNRALIAATKAGRTRDALALLDAGADPNAKDEIQDSAFLYAGAEGLTEILEATLRHGADVRSLNRYGGTALIPACEHGHVANVRILLAAGVDPDHVNKSGWTCLLEAVILGDGGPDHVQTVRLVLDEGANPGIGDFDGVTPRQHAQRRGQSAIVAEFDRPR